MSTVIPGALFSWLPQWFPDATGLLPNANGSVLFTVAGSTFTVKKNTYADALYNTANPNPVLLNAAGYPVNGSALIALFALPGAYDVAVYDVNSVQLYTRLGVEDVGLTFAAQFNSSLMAGARNVNASAGYTILGTDNFITVLNGGTITFPASATRTFPIGVKNLDTANACTLTPTGAEKMEVSESTLTLPAATSTLAPTIWLGPDVVAGAGYLIISSHGLGT
jgi:hypothetical protein